MHYLLKIFLIIFTILPINTFATTIEESISKMKENSDKLAIEMLKVEISESDKLAAWQKFLPNISYQMQRGDGRLSAPSLGAYNSPYQIKSNLLLIEQDLSLQSLIANQIEKNKLLDSANAKYKIFVNNISLEIAQTHLECIIADNKYELSKLLYNIAGNDSSNIMVKKSVGSISSMDADIIESDYISAESQMIQSQIYLDTIKRQYHLLTKEDPDNLELPTKFKLPASNFNEYIEKIYSQNLSIQEISARLDVAKTAKFQSYTDLFIPKFKATYSDGKSVYAFLPGSPTIEQKQIVGSLDFAIYDKGQKIKNISQANIYTRIANRELSLIKESLHIEAKNLWSSHHSLFLLQQSNKRSLDVMNLKYSIANNKYKNGQISKTELMKSIINLYSAKINYLNSYRDFVINYYKMLNLL